MFKKGLIRSNSCAISTTGTFLAGVPALLYQSIVSSHPQHQHTTFSHIAELDKWQFIGTVVTSEAQLVAALCQNPLTSSSALSLPFRLWVTTNRNALKTPLAIISANQEIRATYQQNLDMLLILYSMIKSCCFFSFWLSILWEYKWKHSTG